MILSGYNFTLWRKGTYVIRAYAEFSIEDLHQAKIKEVKLYTKAVSIEIID